MLLPRSVQSQAVEISSDTSKFGLFFYDRIFPSGWQGVIKTIVFTCMILALASLLTRARIRLQL